MGLTLGKHNRYSGGLRLQQLVAAPDGETVYFCGQGKGARGKKPAEGAHSIARFKLGGDGGLETFIGKPDEPGDSPEQLNDPRGLAVDAEGNIYVADFGNNRVAVFDSEGKPLGQTAVERPRMVSVHSSGTMYVLTEPEGKSKWGVCALIKFDKTIGGKEVTRIETTGRGPVIALDPSSEKPRLWLANSPKYKSQELRPILDEGAKLVAGENVLGGAGGGFNSPLYVAADPKHDRLYVGDMTRKILKVDLADGDKISQFLTATEATVDAEGNVYALMGYNTDALQKYGPDGQPANYAGLGGNKIEVKFRAGLPHVGTRGLTVAPNGDIYTWQDNKSHAPEHLWVFGPDGKLKREDALKDVPFDSGNGIAVDRAGNIYAGINVQTHRKLYPAEFEGQIPPLAWYMLYTKQSGWYAFPGRDIPEAPWNYGYLNNYLFLYGSIFKFSPKGGRFWGGGKPENNEGHPRPEGVPADAVEYREAYFKNVTWSAGAEWRYRGFGVCPNMTEGWGDPACSCFSSRFCLDEHDRLFVNDAFRFTTVVLDRAGNEITRIGTYGNLDTPPETIPLAWPNAVAVMKDTAYIVDRKSRRIAVVKLKHDAEAVCAAP